MNKYLRAEHCSQYLKHAGPDFHASFWLKDKDPTAAGYLYDIAMQALNKAVMELGYTLVKNPDVDEIDLADQICQILEKDYDADAQPF